ncbi:TRAP transporter substrate-binding protein [Desulfosporosinus youngiae]|uniref:Tripartite ATP-independent periplasmic transporter solute receptor, DctP family n=1 Tax=Desulfosporosinus youngiae DSM 17734 TaxID=768710 RepID=H5XTQ8_9FIRM|nr:TRAP transporter substrate-binding protein [Desulfosporosinus youngiae]EHQ88791.1 tripartite ATP-independent periplasmic transporter solute receptor, DctP family [Desulfosporosinus youngiae DSM 17734]
MAGKRWILVIIILALGLSGCHSRVIDGQQVNKEDKIIIKFSHVVDENTPKGLAAIRFAQLISERSGGSIEVQVFPNSQLFKDGEEFEALSRGDVQMIAPATSKLTQLFPQWQVMDLPYFFDDLESVHQTMDGPLGKALLSQLEEKNMRGLAMWDSGFKHLTNNVHPIIKPSDFDGLSFRVMSPGILQAQFNKFGAEAVFLPFNDVYEALSKGKVDGQENTISNIYTQQFDQVQTYLTLSQHGFLGYAVIVNAEFWDQLPSQARELLEKTIVEVTEWERETAERLNEEQLEKIKKLNKISIYALTSQEKSTWKADFSSVYSKFEKEIGLEFLNEVRK